jgi:hypothetical protein
MSKRYREKWPDQERAKWAIKNAVRTGTVTKPVKCERCDGEHEKHLIEAHHWSYLKEHWIDVLWLCRKCHKLTHKELGSNWKNAPVRPTFKPEETV